ncbi:MAG: hypothetical protein JRI72_13795, partial [Deltaproteobacteria bacterium]|nr:hypothetical protein [Deltaproteobacteria bacterium]
WEADNPKEWAAKAYDKYLKYRKFLSREDALNKVRLEMTEIKLPPTIKTTSQALEWLQKNKNMSEEEAKAWLRAQR